MSQAEQRDVLHWLLQPATHGLAPDAAIERVDTHIATVVLAGARAYKLKRAVTMPFLDFSTLVAREAACRAELRLNRRTAPEIYLDVVAVTRQAGGRLRFDGDGPVVEWLVAMRRFDRSQLLDRLAQQGRLRPELALSLAATVARFHMEEPPVADGADSGEYARVIAVDDDMLRRFRGEVFSGEAVARLRRRSERRLAALGPIIEARREAGFVRHCHGDLHLRNIFLEDGQPVLFDALEFDERFARTDVMYDLAFLLMDLWHRGLADFANAVLNRYLLLTGDYGGLAPLPLFLSLRAAIRAHVSATMAASAGTEAAAELRDEARAYLSLAETLLDAPTPRLIAVGGFSGSGKSTLARALAPRLAPPPGAVVVRSDELRKHLLGVAPEAPLSESAYAPEVSRRVYAEVRRIAGLALTAGYAAIADAVHDRADARRQIQAVAERSGVPFQGFWLAAAPEIMAGRIERRTKDSSDATAAVMREQIERGAVAGNWYHLDAEASPTAVAAAAMAELTAT